eukprot:154188_1
MGFEINKYLSVIAILGCEFCERLAAFGIGSSLTLFLRSKLGYTIESATIWTAIWGAFATIFSLLGGYLSDARLGRKKTILLGSFIYFLALLTVSIITYLFELTNDLELTSIEAIFWLSLYVMSIGGGGIKANVGVFGADQLLSINNSQNIPSLQPCESDNLISYDVGVATIDLTNTNTNSAELIQSYWNWFYFTINAGALISYTLISYLCQDISFALGWSIPTIAMFCAIVIFLLRSNQYYEPQHDRAMTGKFIGITYYSIKNRHRKKEIMDDIQTNVLETLNNNIANNGDENPNNSDNNFSNITWLDVAKIRYSGEYDNDLVDEVKMVYSVFGFLPFMTLYWIVYAAMNSLFYSQGCQMNYMITKSFDFPIATLNDADIIIILILVPLMDRFIYPWINNTSECCQFTMLKKIGIGYFILAIAMVVAGIVEIWRKSVETYDITSTCDSRVYISNLNVLWQIPQYLLVGTSEVFASITSLEFFSGQGPDSMKSVVYALNLVVTGIGFLLAALLVFIVDLWKPQWIPPDLDDGYLEYYFFLISAIMIVTLIAFIPYANLYKYKPGTDVSNMELINRNIYKPIATDDNDT